MFTGSPQFATIIKPTVSVISLIDRKVGHYMSVPNFTFFLRSGHQANIAVVKQILQSLNEPTIGWFWSETENKRAVSSKNILNHNHVIT